MIRCIEIEALLSDYADGLTDERGRRVVERHIQLCRTCHDGVQAARQLSQQLTRLSLLPSGLTARVPHLQRRLGHKLTRR